MATRSIYLPDALDRAARDAELDVTGLARRAVERELALRHNRQVLAELDDVMPLGPSDRAVAEASELARSDW